MFSRGKIGGFLDHLPRRILGGEWGVKMAPENGGVGTTLATVIVGSTLSC